MIWKGLGILSATAGLVIVFVVGVARLTVPDEPTFSEGFEESAETPEDFVPSATGGVLEVTGAREGIIDLDREVGGPSYGLGDDLARVFFTGDPLAIDQMSYDGLAFFPEPEECEFTEGRHNEEAGLIAVQISCPELVDIRGNGSIALEGYAALPANLVIELDLPDTGGVLTVGEEEWEIVEPVLIVAPGFRGDTLTGVELSMWTRNADKGLSLSYDNDTGVFSIISISHDETHQEVSSGQCTISDETVMVVNPDAEINELTMDCQDIEVPGLGTIDIEGTVVYQKLYGFTEG